MMKNIALTFIAALLLVSCSVETSQDPSEAAKTFIDKYLKGNYDAIYEETSIEMKSFVPKDIFLNTAKTQEKIYGKMVTVERQTESTGNYGTATTNIYNYVLKNEKGEEYDLTAQFLNGHLLKHHIDAPKWGNEPDFAKSLVNPIVDLMKEKNYEKIHELLGKAYPLNQIETLIQKISEECDGVPNKYESCWIDNDESGKMMVAFVYAYEGKGSLDYRFYIEANEYPFAGIFFSPDASTKLPS